MNNQPPPFTNSIPRNVNVPSTSRLHIIHLSPLQSSFVGAHLTTNSNVYIQFLWILMQTNRPNQPMLVKLSSSSWHEWEHDRQQLRDLGPWPQSIQISAHQATTPTEQPRLSRLGPNSGRRAGLLNHFEHSLLISTPKPQLLIKFSFLFFSFLLFFFFWYLIIWSWFSRLEYLPDMYIF